MNGEAGITLDHIGIVVPDLARAADDFAALGFTVSSPVAHETADGTSAGSTQCSIMLQDGYIELQEITGPKGSHLLSAAQEKHFGLNILAFGIDDAPHAHAKLGQTHLPVGEVMEWSRMVHRADGDQEARFKFFVADYDPVDEALLCWVQHVTPDAIREPRLLKHANGATALSHVGLYAVDDAIAERVVKRLQAAGGMASGAHGIAFGPIKMTISKLDTDGGIPSSQWPADAFAADIGLVLTDPSTVADKAKGLGLPVTRWADHVVIDMMARSNTRLILQYPGALT